MVGDVRASPCLPVQPARTELDGPGGKITVTIPGAVGLMVSVDERTALAAGTGIGVREGGAFVPCKEALGSREHVFESKHDYDNSSDIYTPVSIPGATKLFISFDPRTRTERGCGERGRARGAAGMGAGAGARGGWCAHTSGGARLRADYLRLYKDDTRTAFWGASEFTGGRGDASDDNWPGMKGRPELEIEADNFVMYFHSDGSVNDWGFRMIVRAIVPAEPRVFAGDSLTLMVGPMPGEAYQTDPAFGYAVRVTPKFPDGAHRSPALAGAWAAYTADQKGWTLEADAALVRCVAARLCVHWIPPFGAPVTTLERALAGTQRRRRRRAGSARRTWRRPRGSGWCPAMATRRVWRRSRRGAMRARRARRSGARCRGASSSSSSSTRSWWV